MAHKTCLLYCLATLCLVNKIGASLIVNTNSGEVEGKEVPSILQNEKYYAFAGIPYALPPVGELRFMPPEPHPGWEGLLDGKKKETVCFQPDKRNDVELYRGNEDCLHLSIYTPKLPASDKRSPSLPVIVFLYSDLFRQSSNGSKDYGPDFFMNEDVILVNVNHRLGAFGFLSFQDDLIPGNNGIKDVILALKWIKENVQFFGGDPNKITLMGSRSGGVLVDILLNSPKAKGLFSAAIMHSGTSWNSMFFNDKARQKAIELSKALEVEAATSSYLLKQLSKVSADKISGTEPLAVHADEAREIQRGVPPFGPVVEHDHPEAVLTEYPENKPIDIGVPVMVGFNSREAIDMLDRYLQKPQYLTFADRDFLVLFPIRVPYRFKMHEIPYREAVADIKEFYFEEGYIKISKPGEYITYIEDVMTFYPTDYTVRKYTNASSSDVFYYMFDYSGELNMNKKRSLENAMSIDGTWGASLGDDLCYMFVCNGIRQTYKNFLQDEDSEEIKVLRRNVRMWTNFAKTGNPTPPGEDFIWKPATKENKDCLVINEELEMKQRLWDDKIQFWDEWMNRYGAMAVNGVVHDIKDEL